MAHGCLAIRISGERGSGKKLFAHQLYRIYNGKQSRFIVLNCAQQWPKSESDRATRWAKESRYRMRQLLSGPASAVYYLEAIEHMPLDLQNRLADIITCAETIPQPLWFLVSSIEPLEYHVTRGRSSSALLAALDTAHISFAPLRAIPEAIPNLMAALLKSSHLSGNLHPLDLPDAQTMNSIMRYPWPGNLHQLHLLIKHALATGHWPMKINDCQSRQKDTAVKEMAGLKLADLMPLAELSIQKNKALKILLSNANPSDTGLLDLALYDEALSQICD